MTNKLLNEIKRFNSINNYKNYLLTEQEQPEVDPTLDAEQPVDGGMEEPTTEVDPTLDPAMDTPQDPMAGGEDPMADETLAEPVDTASTEEIDITDLVNMTKSIKNDMERTNMSNTDNISKMDGVFSKLNDLEGKLAEMGNIISKIDQLGAKIETMKPVTPEERLEMRSLDSYPFSQTPQQFFDVKQNEMRASGKNEYILTKQDVDNYSKNQIAQSFNPNY